MDQNEALKLLKKSESRFNEHYKDKPIDLSFTDMSGMKIKKAVLVNANMTGADLTKTQFIRCDLTGANLSNTHLNKTRFELSTMERIKIIKTELNKAHFRISSIKESDMHESVFNECEFYKINIGQSNLNKTIFNKGYFYKSEVQGCGIREGSMTEIVINDTNFMDSDLTDSRVQGEIMESSHFGGAILVRADFLNTACYCPTPFAFCL
ncbi:MAG: pentapeptide repeat-containing protein [Proteobacteria bacterium]|nr:pentapeptide repeat-containing protein [Pseudomonadota bacterium]